MRENMRATDSVRAGFVEMGKHTYLLPIILELVYFYSSVTDTSPLLRAVLVFPSLFTLPGATLILALEKAGGNRDLPELIVKGFFASTVIVVVFTLLMLMLGFPLTPFAYSLSALIVVLLSSAVRLIRKPKVMPSRFDMTMATITFLSYATLLLYFSRLPRLFTPDETSYVFSARMTNLSGIVPSMGVSPIKSEIIALLAGRYFWIYLLTAFIGSTGLPAHQASLMGVSFLTATSLASSEILPVKNKWLSVAVFVLVTLNPLLFSFSAFALNDLAVSFYAVFAALCFVRSFSKINDKISISSANLVSSFLSAIVLSLIKPHLLILAAMWLILTFTMFRYRLYKLSRKYKVLFGVVFVSVLLYELSLDAPYVISMWILKNKELGSFFDRFLFISPLEWFVETFASPWWHPNLPGRITPDFTDYVEHHYRLLMPESSSLLVSGVIVALPFMMLWKDVRKDFQMNILASLTTVSFYLFYFLTINYGNLDDISRFSLWMIPLWIPLALMILHHTIADKSSGKSLLMDCAMLLILLSNIYISRNRTGVYVGYCPLSRMWTIGAIMVQFILSRIVLILSVQGRDLLRGDLSVKLSNAIFRIDMRKALFCSLIVLMASNSIYFASRFVHETWTYVDHGLAKMSDTLDDFADSKNLIFANNYIYMRAYVSDEQFENGLLLPPPDTQDGFLDLVRRAPQGTILLISNDGAITWYEYANAYIKDYISADIISPKSQSSGLSRLNLPDTVLQMTFDDANGSAIPDQSYLGNHGINEGAQLVEAYYGKALRLEGEEYVSIPNDDSLNVRHAITISFLALIEHTEPSKGYMILSKGYGLSKGSFDVFVWDQHVCFELGGVGELWFPAEPYSGTWHNFVFTYDGQKMGALVDGSLVASKPAEGPIRVSSYDLEIGRDSERKICYFVGMLDELQISDKPLDITEFVKSLSGNYALRICRLPVSYWETSYYRTGKSVRDVDLQEVSVKGSDITIDEKQTIKISLEIDSTSMTDVCVIVSTDRFAEVHIARLGIGTNTVRLDYPYIANSSWYEEGGKYWSHLAQTRLIVIGGDNVIYNKFIMLHDSKLITSLLLIMLLGILAATLTTQML